MFKKIVVCTDFNDGLLRLARCLKSLAIGGIQEIVFYHSVPLWTEGDIPRVDEDKLQAARDRFAATLADVLPTAPDEPPINVHVEVRSDQLIDNLLEVIQTYQSDLVILGAQSRTLLSEKLFGSTSASLAEKLPIPMLVLRPALLAIFTDEEFELRCQHLLRNLLVAYDGSEAAEMLITAILDRLEHDTAIANANPSTTPRSVQACKLGWVLEDTGRRGIPIAEKVSQAETAIATTANRLQGHGLTVSATVRIGDPITEILKLASDDNISAIAVTAHNLPKLIEWSRHSFANALLRSSLHPVLFFPPQPVV